ncbi:ABC transporter ATP-binding protein [Kibdelosporangium aridum]|uniref:ABC transporter ATP-binding protein n=1 Tax=Kibdelosporangium aridum TaxID=2030 RepID=UPI000A0318C1|nr:ABC transporter ATP-binding protein [Kibdelosporangium aridum]
MLLSLLRGRLRPHRGTIVAILGLQLVQALGLLYLPTINADIVDNGIRHGDTGYILGQGSLMLAAAAVQIGSAIWSVYLGARVAMDVGHELRGAMFKRVRGFSVREVSHFTTPSLITRTTNDVQQVQQLVFTTLTVLFTAPFIGVGGLVLAMRQDVPLSVVPAVAIPVLIITTALVISRMTPPSRAMQDRIDTAGHLMREQITGVRVIRAFRRDHHEQERFAAANTDLMTAALRVGRWQAFFGATAVLVANLAAVAVIALGADRLGGGDLRPGVLIAFLGYLELILSAVMFGRTVFMQAPRARVSAGRIVQVLNTRPTIHDPAAPTRLVTPAGRVDVKDVSFRYPGAENPVLRTVNLIAKPGQTTGIVGSTGSGKTTLINLIARLLDADDGAVLIDGVDIRDMDRSALTNTVCLVTQRAYLFSGTIGSNLRYGNPDADDDELWRALEIAQARDFVNAMPAGLNTPVGQGGGTVSGGQRQLLAIARALVAKPRIYLFDDAFSALDNATDAALRAALAEHLGDATQVIVSQRVATIRAADHITVLDRGRVDAAGTHEELITGSRVYAEIVKSQEMR